MKPQYSDPFSGQISAMLFAVFLLIVSLEVIGSQHPVKSLPGFDGDLPFKLETGYIGVGESDHVQSFYYFIESEGNPKDDPLMLWITGGPSCSSVFGLFYEMGPLTFNSEISTMEKPILEIVPESLTKVVSIIFLDQPAGSGFSYARTPEAYKINDTLSAMYVKSFLWKWLVDHPKFMDNPFYLGGDSYTGIFLPMIAHDIYIGNKVGEQPQINIRGYILGNPLTDIRADYNSRLQFAHNMALLSDTIYESAKESCHGEYLNTDPNSSLCIHDLEVVDKCLQRIKLAHILEPNCFISHTLKSDLLQRDSRLFGMTSLDISPQVQTQSCREDNYKFLYAWANRRDVREALHIHEEFGDTEWVQCNQTLVFYFVKESISYTHNVQNSVGYHQLLSDKKCRALIYSGDHDMIVPYLSTFNWIESLNLSVVDEWRTWSVNKQVAGYTKKYSKDDYNLTFATVKGGGHTAPEYKREECLSMYMRWLANDTL